jgi:hypothetical protein
MTPAPFSKFYLEIDNDSPGRIGAWIGWQMVRSYMKNKQCYFAGIIKNKRIKRFLKSQNINLRNNVRYNKLRN